MGAILESRLVKHLLENLGIMNVIFWCDMDSIKETSEESHNKSNKGSQGERTNTIMAILSNRLKSHRFTNKRNVSRQYEK